MSDNTNDDGPAFPVQDMSKWQCPGMSLRDYFAAKALTGVFTTAQGLGDMDDYKLREQLKAVADIMYKMADAMLAARGVKS